MSFDSFRNPDGTYNGVKLFAAMTGLSEAEIAWTAKRAQRLYAEGKTKDEVKRALTEEGRAKPWQTAAD